jgi:hypothetical protein
MKYALQEEMLGTRISLDLLRDVGSTDTWNFIYKYFLRIQSIRFNDEDIFPGQLEYYWGIFKSTGVITFRVKDKAKVHEIMTELKKALMKEF